ALATAIPIPLGTRAGPWVHYLELGSWLERQSRAPAPRGSQARHGTLELLESLRIFDVFRGALDGPLPRVYRELLDGLREYPEDGRLWLLLGLALEREQL